MEKIDTKARLYQKILTVMSSVTHVEKNSRNTQQGYDYASEADVLAELRQAFIENGLIALPTTTYAKDIESFSTKNGSSSFLTSLIVEYQIIDTETGESITVSMAGQGSDFGDKGAYKAITGATKYMLLKTFMIPTGDDPEKDDVQPVKKQPVQRVNQVTSQTDVQADAELNALDEAEERQALLERKGLLTDEEKAFIEQQQTPTPGVSDKTCEVCSQDLTYREGVSKAGKPYKGWFCSEKDHPVQWVK